MKLSVVVPTLNEERYLATTLEAIPKDAEIIVSDGGSVDETVAIAKRHEARVMSGDRGRARQMNRGAETAAGDVLLFLHADCTLGPEASNQIERVLRDADVVGGSFRMSIRRASWSLRLIAAAANARARLLKMPYGDQAIFVRRRDFDAIGGFPEIPFMEDVAFVRSLKRRGKLVCLSETVTTGARHWERLGPVTTTLLNWTMVTLYLLGVPPDKLAPYYRRWRQPRKDSESANVYSS